MLMLTCVFGWVLFFTRNREIELKLKEKKERKRNSIAAPLHAALRKKGGDNDTAQHCDVFGRGKLEVYDSLRSTILVRHANVEGRNRPFRCVLLSRFFDEFSMIARTRLIIGPALAWQSICG